LLALEHKKNNNSTSPFKSLGWKIKSSLSYSRESFFFPVTSDEKSAMFLFAVCQHLGSSISPVWSWALGFDLSVCIETLTKQGSKSPAWTEAMGIVNMKV